MRRRAGVGAIHKKTLEQEKYRDKGSEIQGNQLEQLSKQLEQFRSNLEDFAAKHRREIKLNSQFRRQFLTMCASIGVDPLSCAKGFWSVLGMGDFYYELAVQIIEVCIATSDKNGGLIGLDELRTRLIRARGLRKEHQEITNDDLHVAARKLRALGGGFTLLEVSKKNWLVQSVPVELSMDHTTVLQVAASQRTCCVTSKLLQSHLKWHSERAQQALDFILNTGLAWIDFQSSEVSYWFPSMFDSCIQAQ